MSHRFAVFFTLNVGSQVVSRDSLADDRAHRDTAINWAKEFDPSVAPVFSHNELLLSTDCHRAFLRLADATAWPTWFLLTKDVVQETPGPIQQGSLLRLKIFNSPIESRVSEFLPDSRLSWIPFGADETETRHGHYHAWHFIPEPAGCRVVTEETGIGPNDIKDPQSNSRLCTAPMISGSPPSAGRRNHERPRTHSRNSGMVQNCRRSPHPHPSAGHTKDRRTALPDHRKASRSLRTFYAGTSILGKSGRAGSQV